MFVNAAVAGAVPVVSFVTVTSAVDVVGLTVRSYPSKAVMLTVSVIVYFPNASAPLVQLPFSSNEL